MLVRILLCLLLSLMYCLPALATTEKTTKLMNLTKPINTYTEDKQSIAVTPDQPEFVIKLKSNPTTGYAWFLREYDNYLLIPVKHNYQKSDQKLMGAPSYELWTFKVKPTGFVVPQQTILRLVYTRPWQGTDGSTQLMFRISTLA